MTVRVPSWQSMAPKPLVMSRICSTASGPPIRVSVAPWALLFESFLGEVDRDDPLGADAGRRAAGERADDVERRLSGLTFASAISDCWSPSCVASAARG